jgi:hypothetical protein
VDPTADDERDDLQSDGPAEEPDEQFDGPYDDYEAPVSLDLDAGDVVANARRRYGGGGALLAAGMLGLDKLLTDKKKPDSVQVQEAASEPIDVDKSGIQVMIDELTSVEAPPLDRREPLSMKKKRRRR